MEALLDPAGPAGEFGGERGLEFQLGGGEVRAEAEVLGGTGGAGQEQGAGLDVGQAGEAGAVAVHEAESAGRPAVHLDGDPGGAERVDVPVHGADGDLELGGEFGGGHPAPVLEEQEEGEEAVGAHDGIVRHT